jgi:hypothetical protein
MNRYEREIKAIDQARVEHAQAIKSLYDKERTEDRNLTDEERLEVEGHTKSIRVLDEQKEEAQANLKTLEHAEDISRKLGPAVPSMSVDSEPQDRAIARMKSLGELFTDSTGYKSVISEYRENGGRFREGFSTGAVMLDAKGTFLEGAGGGGGAIAATVPQVIPGVVDKLFQRSRSRT